MSSCKFKVGLDTGFRQCVEWERFKRNFYCLNTYGSMFLFWGCTSKQDNLLSSSVADRNEYNGNSTLYQRNEVGRGPQGFTSNKAPGKQFKRNVALTRPVPLDWFTEDSPPFGFWGFFICPSKDASNIFCVYIKIKQRLQHMSCLHCSAAPCTTTPASPNFTFDAKKDVSSQKRGNFLIAFISDTHPINMETATAGLFFLSCLPANV